MINQADIVERLRATECLGDALGNPIDVPINPDGPEAADIIEKHRAAIAVTDVRIAELENQIEMWADEAKWAR